jgi:hypothetical protein
MDPPRRSQWNLATETEPAVSVKALRALLQQLVDDQVFDLEDWTRELEALCDAAEQGPDLTARW